MTDDQVEKAIGFLLASQAALTTDLQELTARVDAVTALANTSFELVNRTAEVVTALATAQATTNEQIRQLSAFFGQHVSDGHGGQTP
jgi:hypothetical protein